MVLSHGGGLLQVVVSQLSVMVAVGQLRTEEAGQSLLELALPVTWMIGAVVSLVTGTHVGIHLSSVVSNTERQVLLKTQSDLQSTWEEQL